MSKFLTFALAVAALLAGSGIFYHYVIYVPHMARVAELDKEPLLSNQQEDGQEHPTSVAIEPPPVALITEPDFFQKEEQLRLAEEVKRREVESNYRNCLTDASNQYHQNWAGACQNVANELNRQMQNCLETPRIMENQFMGQPWCEKMYGGSDSSENCTLPSARADGINKYHDDAKQQCKIFADMQS